MSLIKHAMALIILVLGLYVVWVLFQEERNFNTQVLTVLIVFSIAITVYVHKKVQRNASVIKTTIASFILTVPAQELYALDQTVSGTKFDTLKQFGLLSIVATVVLFLLWGYASVRECMPSSDNKLLSPYNLSLYSAYACIGFIVVNYRAAWAMCLGWFS